MTDLNVLSCRCTACVTRSIFQCCCVLSVRVAVASCTACPAESFTAKEPLWTRSWSLTEWCEMWYFSVTPMHFWYWSMHWIAVTCPTLSQRYGMFGTCGRSHQLSLHGWYYGTERTHENSAGHWCIVSVTRCPPALSPCQAWGDCRERAGPHFLDFSRSEEMLRNTLRLFLEFQVFLGERRTFKQCGKIEGTS